jgi:hypothetical protein
MANKKKAERATTSRERRLALALVGIRDALEGHEPAIMMSDALIAADNTAADVLKELNYGDLIGIPRRIAALNEQLTKAVAASDGATIAALGKELVRAQAGKPPLAVKKAKTEAAKA